MRTGSLALVLLLGGAITAHADYYRFIYIPYATPEKEKEKEPGAGALGMRPGFPGQPGAANIGMQPGAANIGMQPGMRPGMQFQGMQFQGMQFAGMGMQQGMMPGMMPGMRPKPKPGEQAPPEPDEDDEVDLSLVRHVVVEVKNKKAVPRYPKLMIETKYGWTTLHKADAVSFKKLLSDPDRAGRRSVIPTTAKRYEARKKDLVNEKKTADPEKILETAELCLSWGLYDKFPKEMEDLVEKAPKHPSSIAYKKMLDALKKAPTKPDASAYWKDRLSGNFRVTTTTHYACLYSSREETEVTRRLKRFEDNFRAFYYWFALKGIALPALDQRQVVIFVGDMDKPEEFDRLCKVFGATVLDGDGFLARRENVGIFSMTPKDEFYDLLSKSSNLMWTQEKWNKVDLLAGRFKAGEKVDDSAYAQEIALLLKGMEDECELAAITKVGSQQLCTALGLVPRAVSIPMWLNSGLGSLFETPKGAYWPGTGGAHWKYHVNFISWRDNTQTREKPEDILINTITDQYFLNAQRTNDPATWEKAQTMSWALTYFLIQDQNNRDNFFKYLHELSQLPRDMQISTDTHLLLFVRAFGLVTEPDVSKIDMATVRKGVKDFARNWYMKYMSTVQLDMPDVWALWKKTEAQKAAKLVAAEADAKKMPGMPGIPGAPGVGPAMPPVRPGNGAMPPPGVAPMPPGPRRPAVANP
jgi:hypothetical protein